MIFQTGEHAGRTLAVRQGVIVVGRGEGCDLPLAGDGEVSAKHARLEENAAGVFLCGLDAERPVRCNGEEVGGSRCLRDGDVIGIGATEIVFRRGGAEVKRKRLKVSHGVMQPLAVLCAAALVGFELMLLRFLIVWPYEVISYQSEEADKENAEILREQLADEEAKEKEEGASAKAAALALPGSTGGGAGNESDGTTGTGGPDPSADPAGATAAALEVLESADFEPASAETDLRNLPPISAADPRIADAQRMLAQADTAAQFADYAGAERLLMQLHKAAPGFLPAYETHAKVLEMQGKFQDSLIRWRQLRGLSKEGSPFRTRAEDGLRRVDGLLAARKAGTGKAAAPGPGPAEGVRLAEPDVVRLPDGADADVVEMRVLRTAVELDAHAAVAAPPGTALRLEIEFFDRRPDGKVERSVALTQGSPVALQMPGKLPARLPIDNFTYVVTRGMKARRGDAEYYGCRMRLYAGGRLLAEQAKPRKLLTEAP